MNRLSPATLDGMRAWGDRCAEADTDDIEVERVTMYVCPTCGDTHEDETDAVECCANKRAEPGLWCPVCGAEHSYAQAAADCCLWKDIDAFRRYRIAQMVEGGMPWREAIERWT